MIKDIEDIIKYINKLSDKDINYILDNIKIKPNKIQPKDAYDKYFVDYAASLLIKPAHQRDEYVTFFNV